MNVLKMLIFKAFYDNDVHDDLIQYKYKFINLQKKDIVHYNQEIKNVFQFSRSYLYKTIRAKLNP